MSDSIIVYTCILNGFDNLHRPLEDALIRSRARYICFTDLPQQAPVPPWEFRPAYQSMPSSSRNSRVPKILPHLMLPDCEYSIWHDGCFALKRRPEDIVSDMRAADISLHKHPARNCIYQEGELCIAEKIGNEVDLKRQLSTYSQQGHPQDAGLWACGMIARRHNSDVAAFNESWWQLYAAGSDRDQISFPVAVRQTGVHVHTISADVYSGPNMGFYWHDAFKGRGDVDDYAAARAKVRFKLERLRGLVAGQPSVVLP